MTRIQVLNHVEGYLRSCGIQYTKDADFTCEAPRLTMLYPGNPSCPDGILEGSLWLHRHSMEARVYFDENASRWCRNSPHIPQLLRLFNFFHARVWPSCGEGARGTLYTPRLYLSEDSGYDIVLTTAIAYDFFAVAPLEAEEYISIFSPALLNELSPAIFGVLLGRMDVDQGIQYITHRILEQ